MPWVDWTLLGVLAGGFAYGVATIAIRERSLPFIIRQREESMDFSLHEGKDKDKEKEELTFTDARHEFNKILMELMEKREELLEKARLRDEKEAAEAEAKAIERKLVIMKSIQDAAEKEALKQKKEADEYAARKEKERVELESFKERMDTKRKEEEERLRVLEVEENSARIADEAVRQENMLAMEAQRNFEVETQVETESEGIEADVDTQKELEQRLEREGAKSGEVQISLMWNDRNDLDLHVLCPSGERIHGGNRDSKCGGELDVDMNVRAESKRPVESVVWGEGAPPGVYKAYVHFYKHHPKRRTKKHSRFTVVVNAGGEVKEYTDSLSLGDPIKHIAEFSMPELNQRIGYEPETSLERVKLDIENASTIEEYQDIDLEGIPAGLKLVWEENIQRKILDLENLAEQEAKEARFEDVKQMLILATSPEEIEDIDFTVFDEDETQRLNDILEGNIDVQQATKYNELLERITTATRATEIQGTIISGVNDEQRALLKETKDEVLERFNTSLFSEAWGRIDAASTSEELNEIEFVGINEEQMKSLMEHLQGRFLELQNIESFDDIIRESDIDDEDEITLTDEFKEVLSETLVGEDNFEEASEMAKELHTVIEAETIEGSITEETLETNEGIEELPVSVPVSEVPLQTEGESEVESFDEFETPLSDEVEDTLSDTTAEELETPETKTSFGETLETNEGIEELPVSVPVSEVPLQTEGESEVESFDEFETPLSDEVEDTLSDTTAEELETPETKTSFGEALGVTENVSVSVPMPEGPLQTEEGESEVESFDDLLRELDAPAEKLEAESDIDEFETPLSDEVEDTLSDTTAEELDTPEIKNNLEEALETIEGIEESTVSVPVSEESLQTEEGESEVESFDDLLKELDAPVAELETESDIGEVEPPQSVEVEDTFSDTPAEELDAPENEDNLGKTPETLEVIEEVPVSEESLQTEEGESEVESLEDLLGKLEEESDIDEVESPLSDEVEDTLSDTTAEELDAPVDELEAEPDIDEVESPLSDEVEDTLSDTTAEELETPETPLERIKNKIANASTIEEYQDIDLEGIPAGLKQVWKENIQRNIDDLEETELAIGEISPLPSEDEAGKFDLLPIGSEMKLSSALVEELDKRLKYQGTERADWEVSLIWNNKNDLDLHLSTPAGNIINVDAQYSPCGGQLVAAMNSKSASKKPIEHIIWHSKPPVGTYEVSVDHFRKRLGLGTRDPTSFVVVLNRKGSLSCWGGEISSSEPTRSVFKFEIH